MKLSEIIRNYIDLKIEGQPKPSEWGSIEGNNRRRDEYFENLEALEEAIDAAILASKATTAVGG